MPIANARPKSVVVGVRWPFAKSDVRRACAKGIAIPRPAGIGRNSNAVCRRCRRFIRCSACDNISSPLADCRTSPTRGRSREAFPLPLPSAAAFSPLATAAQAEQGSTLARLLSGGGGGGDQPTPGDAKRRIPTRTSRLSSPVCGAGRRRPRRRVGHGQGRTDPRGPDEHRRNAAGPPGVTASSFGPTASRPICAACRASASRILVDGIGASTCPRPIPITRSRSTRSPPSASKCCAAHPRCCSARRRSAASST